MPTQREFADHVGVSQPLVSDLLRRGVLPRDGTLDQWRLAYCKHLREQAAGRQSDGGELDLVAERARLTHHQANIAALDEDTKRGNLIPAEQVEQAWGDLVFAARARLLSIPTKAAPLVQSAENRAEVESILKATVYEALEELSHGGDRPHHREDAIAVVAAAEPDGERVGEPTHAPKRRGQRRARPV